MPSKSERLDPAFALANYAKGAVFGNGQLIFHKTFMGPEPVGKDDTVLYEGGHNNWYETYSREDTSWIVWAGRLDYALRHH